LRTSQDAGDRSRWGGCHCHRDARPCAFGRSAGKARLRGSLLESDAVLKEWSSILGGIRARLLAVPSRAGQRLPHLGAHDVAEIDAEVRAALAELGEDRGQA
jgi:phage terminase Nu1 subunit (DNA packaging protein)